MLGLILVRVLGGATSLVDVRQAEQLVFTARGQIVDLRNGLLLFRTLPGKLVALIVVVSYVLIFVEAVAVNRVLLGP